MLSIDNAEVYNLMRSLKILKIVFIIFTILYFSSCGENEEKQKDTIKNFSNIQENSNTFEIKPQRLKVVDAFVSSVKSDYKDYDTKTKLLKGYLYDDIVFSKNENTNSYTIYNNTPFEIKEVPISYLSSSFSSTSSPPSNTYALMRFSKTIPAFSDADFKALDNIPSNISFDNQMKLFLPHIDVSSGDPTCDDTNTSVNGCKKAPNKAEEKTYRIIVANIHNALNRVDFDDLIHKFFDDKCKTYPDCASYANKAFSFATDSMLKYGYEGFGVSLQTIHADKWTQNREAWGSVGAQANMNDYYTSIGGWASYWHSYLDPKESGYEGFDWNNYKTIFHEMGHVFGYLHSSGMTYGMDGYFSSYIHQDKFKDYIDKVGALEVPKVFVGQKMTEKNRLKLSFYYLAGDAPYSKITIKLLSNKAISGYFSYLKDGNSITLNLDKYLTIPLFVRAKTSDSQFYSTVKVHYLSWLNLSKYKIGNEIYTVLDDNDIVPTNFHFSDLQKVCGKYDFGNFATKAQYQKLWDYMHKNNILNNLKKKEFLSSDEIKYWYTWKITFKQDSMTAESWNEYQKTIGDKIGIVCVKKL